LPLRILTFINMRVELRQEIMRQIGKLHLTHGDSKTVEYHAWNMMIQRCYNPCHSAFADYGGRGIYVCDRWHEYKNFLTDMGRRPVAKTSLDRIDNDGWYKLSNCRWATWKEQNNNQRKRKALKVSKTPDRL